MAQQPQTNKQPPVTDTTKPPVQQPDLPNVTVKVDGAEVKGAVVHIDGEGAAGTLIGDLIANNSNDLIQLGTIGDPIVGLVEGGVTMPILPKLDGSKEYTEGSSLDTTVEELILCPDTLINTQLVRGLEGIRELHETNQMSKAGPFHVDVYNSLSRILTLLSWEDTKTTLDNLFSYMNNYSEKHCHQNIILQNVSFCTLSKSSQLEYTKLMSLFISLQNPTARGANAKRINWSTFPAGFTSAHGEVYTYKFKRYFNIV